MTDSPTDTWTLGQTREWQRQHAEDGRPCANCSQLVKVYHRPLNANMASALVFLWQAAGMDWCHIRTTLPDDKRFQHREEGKLRYWGLLEEETTRRADGGRAGWWRVTPEGARFVTGTCLVPKYAAIYDAKLQRLHGVKIGIHQALSTKFDYAALMRGQA